MALNFNRVPGPGETRDCTDPWKLVLLRANGDVSLCCQSRAVGNTHRTPLREVLEGEAAVDLRRRLLAGDLAEDCLRCAERGVTTAAELRARVQRVLTDEPVEQLADARRELRERREQRAELVRERDGLARHARTLELERDALRVHVHNLEAERVGLRRHADNLEQERTELRRLLAERVGLLDRVRSALGLGRR